MSHQPTSTRCCRSWNFSLKSHRGFENINPHLIGALEKRHRSIDAEDQGWQRTVIICRQLFNFPKLAIRRSAENCQFGLKADGVDGSCSNQRRDALYCRFRYLHREEPPHGSYHNRPRSMTGRVLRSNVPRGMAKNIFQVHGITKDEEVAFNRPLRRAPLLPFFPSLNPA